MCVPKSCMPAADAAYLSCLPFCSPTPRTRLLPSAFFLVAGG